MEYNFYNFNSTEFEHLIQSLAQKLLGSTSSIFGQGRDGGRELTYTGTAPYPNEVDKWEGYWVVQAKYKARVSGKDDSFGWVAKNFKGEMDKFVRGERKLPDNYLFFTNAVLTAVPESGGRDKMEELAKEYTSDIPNISIIGYDELCGFIDNNEDVRAAYGHLLTPGDVLKAILERMELSEDDVNMAGTEIRERNIKPNDYFNIGLNLEYTSPLIGIDFGTSYSIAALSMGNSEIRYIPSDKGQIVVPSSVTFFKDGSYVVGKPEYINLDGIDQHTVSNVKRNIGTAIDYRIFGKSYTPEYISSLIVRSLKINAEEFLGYEINNVVISKPANYNINQTNSLISIFQRAGLTIKRILEEPSSACLVIASMENLDILPTYKDESIIYLTLDLGGGTFDLSIVEFGDGVFEVISILGDNYLGGLDYDTKIFQYALSEMKERYSRITRSQINKLHYESERVKKDLALSDSSNIIVRDIELPNGNLEDFRVVISKEKFIELTGTLNDKIDTYMEQILKAASTSPHRDIGVHDVQVVLLTGQGGKIFTVRQIIERWFPKASVVENYSENAVVTGTANMSGVLTGIEKGKLLLSVYNSKISMKCKRIKYELRKKGLGNEVISIVTVSAETEENNRYHAILEENTTIPTRQPVSIIIDNTNKRDFVEFELYEFSNSDDANYFLGSCKIPIDKNVNEMVLEIDANSTMELKIGNRERNEFSYFQLNNFKLNHHKKVNFLKNS